MFNVKDKTCLEEGCKTRPCYGNEDGKALYCSKHKKEGMFDVKNKTCVAENCKTQPRYGNYELGKIHCAKHCSKKSEWLIKSCNNCRNIAIRSETGNLPYTHCDNCAPIDYKSQMSGICKSCNLTNMLLDADNKCLLSCSKIHKERIKYSENEMEKVLINNKFDFVNDKTVDGGCSLRRPDFIMDLNYGILIIENDENQHKSRLCECEQTRMIQIFQDHGGIPVHFIRFNPDTYKTNKAPESLGKRHNFLVSVIKKIKKDKEFFQRNKNLTVSYLYYDNYDGIWEVNKIDY